jgi:hypothetical protein
MALSDPQPNELVRLVGVTVLDPSLASDESARASWIGDGWSAEALLRQWRAELDRFDALAAVGWGSGVAEVLAVFVNP